MQKSVTTQMVNLHAPTPLSKKLLWSTEAQAIAIIQGLERRVRELEGHVVDLEAYICNMKGEDHAKHDVDKMYTNTVTATSAPANIDVGIKSVDPFSTTGIDPASVPTP